ncbi:MAG: Ig-like domain-containing protein [Gammaproteobacteria bacterium]|nr:Ig-like domain-containing protein [Gammaproteobacteria bacterium]
MRSTNPPHVSILSPNYGAKVGGTIELLADAYGDGDVAGVRFTLDGKTVGEEIDTSPYFLHWDTRETTNGEHVLIAIAKDAADNHGVSVPFDITIEN